MKHSKVDAANIHELVHSFYGRIRNDQELGPIFNDVIMDNWDRHLNTMVMFWTSVMLSSGLYKGSSMVKHVALKNVTPAHFELWLGCFRVTSADLFEPDVAVEFVIRAERIAESFQHGMFHYEEQFKVVNAPL